MRVTPNHPRLRVIALGCWILSSCCIMYSGYLIASHIAALLLLVSIGLLGLLSMAIGVAFWLLSTDRRAGIVFDSKGLMLNLGHSSAFISWQNIKHVGVTEHRGSLFALGSRRQLGIALRDVQPYLQSYEARLPIAQGPLSKGIQLIDALLRPYRRVHEQPIAAQLATSRAHTGYDVLIPEALLGGTAVTFVELVELYRLRPSQRRTLQGPAWAA